MELGPREIGIAEVTAGQLNSLQPDTGKIRTNIRMLDPPRVPSARSLPYDRGVL